MLHSRTPLANCVCWRWISAKGRLGLCQTPDVFIAAVAWLCLTWYENSRQSPTQAAVMKLKAYRVSGFETNKIRQVTEGICLKEQERPGQGGQTNKPTNQNSGKQGGTVDSQWDYAIFTAALTWYSIGSHSWINGMHAGYLLPLE